MLSLATTSLLLVATTFQWVDAPVSSPDAGVFWADPPSFSELIPSERPAVQVGLPERLRIPSIDVDAEVEHVGLAADGSMGVPEDPDRVAWFQLGPRPGQPGNAAIAGHVDWAGRVRAFWWLSYLDVGDTIEVVTEEGAKYQFAVQWSRWYQAEGAPVEEVFGGSEVPDITLITCGGAFDRQTRQYLSRLVVRAALQPGNP